MRLFSALVFLALLLHPNASQAQPGQVFDQLRSLQQALTVPVGDWKFHQPDIQHGEDLNLSEADWKPVQTGFHWGAENTRAWFRTHITIPETIAGFPTQGFPVRMRIGMDDDGEIYVNGQLQQKFHWDDGNITLTEHARPGQTFVIAVRGINGAGEGELRYCRLTYDVLNAWQPQFNLLLQEATFLQQLAPRADVPQHTRIAQALQQCEASLDLKTFRRDNARTGRASLVAARETLRPLAPLIQQYRVTYVGHSHIDMNWLWTWPETIDACQRTWDSALKLMKQFPDFGFVQSQPGAYVPIEQQFPAEFIRMQHASRRGQWDVVGGLWNESDTNMPSGEALARSLFLGQRYFQQHFGRSAETGWLPDSFGHSAQLPQLYQGVGLHNFYHQRGGDGTRFAWWQSLDGSRILKAQTDHYDASVEPDQLTEPWDNARRYGLKQSLIVFGVGDHGGGPTREQILRGKSFQQSALLPQVQFLTADAFFRQLRADPVANALPVISTDLQYVAVGGYTTHADVKADVRGSENDLYTAEALASMAAMHGRPYPVQGFTEAWKPTAFAQFHDIMCGSAIHSTYTWMHEQLAPARRFEAEQITQTLKTLSAATDTRGGQKDDPAVVVWNPLSFRRDDVVRVKVPDARRFRSIYDATRHRYPVQVEDSQTLVFVALQVPGFGRAVYYLSPTPCTPTSAVAQSIGNSLVLNNAFSRLRVSKETGLITELLHKATGRQMLAPGQPGNVLQILDDDANAWDIHFTGPPHELAKEDAQVTLIAAGPVYSVVQVEHTYNRSRFVQKIRVYNQIPRIDIPTTVDWHEHGRMLKVAFPLHIAHPDYRTSIPYGSLARPHNGQETPGQKWMDVTETSPGTLGAATPVDIQSLFNHNSGGDFDTEGRGFPRSEFPHPGVRTFGTLQVPVRLVETKPNLPDNVACAGQSLAFPANAVGNTLFLVGASAPGAQDTGITFVQADGAHVMRTVHLNDWMIEDRQSNDVVATFSHQVTHPGRNSNGGEPRLWLTAVAVPAGGIKKILLPDNKKMHLFAITLAQVGAATPRFGMTVLNDCKYGSDATGSLFRLSLLRSPNNPDPNPDEGRHTFTYSLWPHAGDSRAGAAEQAGLALNIPLRGVLTDQHVRQGRTSLSPFVTIQTADHQDNLVAGALKHTEDGKGYILRFFETQGRNTTALLTFSQPVIVEETDLLERPLSRQRWTMKGQTVCLPVGHDKIVTLHITGLPDAGRQRLGL